MKKITLKPITPDDERVKKINDTFSKLQAWKSKLEKKYGTEGIIAYIDDGESWKVIAHAKNDPELYDKLEDLTIEGDIDPTIPIFFHQLGGVFTHAFFDR